MTPETKAEELKQCPNCLTMKHITREICVVCEGRDSRLAEEWREELKEEMWSFDITSIQYKRLEDFIANLLAEQKKALIQELLDEAPEDAVRDEEPLPLNYTRTQLYNKEANLNMADGFNQANNLWKEKLQSKLK